MSSRESLVKDGPSEGTRYTTSHGPLEDEFNSPFPWERFKDKTLRRNFIVNVYALHCIQLTVVLSFALLCYFW